MARKYATQPFGTGRFEVVYQYGNIKSRVDVYQEMHVVLFAAKLDQATAPAPQDLRERFFGIGQHAFGKHLSPVLGNEHNMQPKQINRVR